MKRIVAAIAVIAFAASVTTAVAGGCHGSCADGYTYSKSAGKCVKKSISS